jgi:hypothetical protein
VKLALVLLVALVACGDSHHAQMPDAGAEPMPDAMADAAVDAPPAAATLTSYVKDLILNWTSSTTAARPYSEFATLPDPDGDSNNGSAYSDLF